MKYLLICIFSLSCLFSFAQEKKLSVDEQTIRTIFDQSLVEAECYERLRYLCKDIGQRLSGSEGADKSVDWAVKEMQALGFDTVYKQPCMVPVWVRGEEASAKLHSKKLKEPKQLKVTTLGYSPSTPKGGIKAKVVMYDHVHDVEELGEDDLKGKIVFFNRPMDPKLIETFHAYGGCVDQRSRGAIVSQTKGAIGVIVRSMGLRNDDFPHTGTQDYTGDYPEIPAVAVSTKGADDLEALLKKDKNLEIEMIVNSYMEDEKLSYNVIGEVFGSEKPDEYIVVSGHLDSWDIAEGAHDDGAGVVQSIEVLNLFKVLKLNNKHTLRAVLFMNEENGTRGARKYRDEVERKGEKHIVAIESDSGGFVPRGFNVDGIDGLVPKVIKQIEGWHPMLEPYNLHRYKPGYSGVDINFLKDMGFPLIGFYPDPQRYFDIHHTELDVFESVNERELVLGAASITSLVYLIDKYGTGAPTNKVSERLSD